MRFRLLLPLLLLGPLAGCTDDNALVITRFLAIDASCTAKPQGLGISFGILDLSRVSGWGYVAAPTVRYNVTGGKAIQLTSFGIELQLPRELTDQLPADTQYKFSQPVAADLLQTPPAIEGESGITEVAKFVEVLPVSLALQLKPLFPADGSRRPFTVRLRAQGTGPDGFVTGPFADLPVYVCGAGCVVANPSSCFTWQF